ncbi:hypothetical protein HETIRDRAFT_420654 [Heterobasidion irregulare TC 32-1]|uniref:Uncharacterized protein n=1 Tax=Heterobasidion irregulare (strain TC 32-1) TaxID=747525 RepID=W4JWB3_HETIT|nr:uncharacterized protein HETIRDRAFT_420654 [Heterobasidion irregulare TC 32-1]ETW77827.1 hypothetical protein HETIRDRAFT_420654 [Heterobasidion irregulare TC 32-1]
MTWIPLDSPCAHRTNTDMVVLGNLPEVTAADGSWTAIVSIVTFLVGWAGIHLNNLSLMTVHTFICVISLNAILGLPMKLPSTPLPSPTALDIRPHSELSRRFSFLESMMTSASLTVDQRRCSPTLSLPNALPSGPCKTEKTLPPHLRVPMPMATLETDRSNRLSRMEPGLGLVLDLLPIKVVSPPPSLRAHTQLPHHRHTRFPPLTRTPPVRTGPAALPRIPNPPFCSSPA